MNADWQDAALAHGFTVHNAVVTPDSYYLWRGDHRFGAFSNGEAAAFVAGLNVAFVARAETKDSATDTCAEEAPPTEADSKLAAMTACTTIVNAVEADSRSNVIQALARLFGIVLPSVPQRPMGNYLEVLQRTRERIIVAANAHGGSLTDPWWTILIPLDAAIAEAEAAG